MTAQRKSVYVKMMQNSEKKKWKQNFIPNYKSAYNWQRLRRNNHFFSKELSLGGYISATPAQTSCPGVDGQHQTAYFWRTFVSFCFRFEFFSYCLYIHFNFLFLFRGMEWTWSWVNKKVEMILEYLKDVKNTII